MQDFFLFIQHHAALSAGLLAVLVLAVIVEFYRLQQGIKRISPAETVRLINRENAVVLDMRSQEDFRAGHITNAISFPSEQMKNTGTLQKIMAKCRNRIVVMVGSTDADGLRTAKLLKQSGMDVRVLAGGIRAFREADLPLVK
jgi:rhodanese-related sulfurtransferase